ncbi:MAG: AMP-binding protein [Clostridia bacterium]|nr:AMP-binding protein [Deltaproteobacteria bacterium]
MSDWVVPDASAIPNPLQSIAVARPQHVVLVADDGEWTASSLADIVAAQAARFAARGVRPGSRVVLTGVASADWVIAFHALGWLGATVAPLAVDSPREVAVRDVLALTPDFVINTHGAEALTPEALEIPLERMITFDASPPASDAARAPERFWPWNEPRIVVLTSGTTGTPRPIVLTTQQIVLTAFGSLLRLEHRADDRWLACLPLHHVGGLSVLLRCALYGTTVVLHRRFVAARVARALDSGEATMVSLVPTMLERVLDVRDAKPFAASFRVALVGGARCPPALVARCRDLAVPIALTWGMSEAASQIATRIPGDTSDDAGSGAPLGFVRVREHGGLLEVTGPTINGTLLTRDLGQVDALGRVHVFGREDGVIVSGGEKIDPLGIERALSEHTAIKDVAVIGIPNARWGERPVALLVAKGEPVSDAELDAWCAERLPRFEIPNHYVWFTTLTTHAMDKRSRTTLTARLRAEAPHLFSAQESETTQGTGEIGGEARRLEGGRIDEGMHDPNRRTYPVVSPDDAINESYRALSGFGDLQSHNEAFAKVHRPAEIGITMDNGRAPPVGIEQRLNATRRHGKKFFESLVAIFENPRKVDDSGAVNVAESRRE